MMPDDDKAHYRALLGTDAITPDQVQFACAYVRTLQRGALALRNAGYCVGTYLIAVLFVDASIPDLAVEVATLAQMLARAALLVMLAGLLLTLAFSATVRIRATRAMLASTLPPETKHCLCELRDHIDVVVWLQGPRNAYHFMRRLIASRPGP